MTRNSSQIKEGPATAKADIIAKLADRLEEIQQDLREAHASGEPHRLKTGSGENIHWHTGYASALKDVLVLLTSKRPARRISDSCRSLRG